MRLKCSRRRMRLMVARLSGQRDAQAGPALPPQRLDLRHPIGAGAARRALRSRRAVPQALAPQFAVAPHPLGRGFALTLKAAAAAFNVHPCWLTLFANSSRLISVSRAFL